MSEPGSLRAPSGFHEGRNLGRDDLLDDPIAQVASWLADAERAGVALPNAMALATADAKGRPSVRHVLLRALDDRGFVFYTNTQSRKGRELAANPHASAVFLWRELDRQIIVTGGVEPVVAEEADAYFESRPREAQLGAWASPQSAPLPDRAALDRLVEEARERFGEEGIPRPPHWSGYRIAPETIECWQGRKHRLHDRFRYERADDEPTGWRIDRLAP